MGSPCGSCAPCRIIGDIIHALRHDQEVTLTTEAETVIYSVTQTLSLTRALPDGCTNKRDILGRDQLVDLIGLLG